MIAGEGILLFLFPWEMEMELVEGWEGGYWMSLGRESEGKLGEVKGDVVGRIGGGGGGKVESFLHCICGVGASFGIFEEYLVVWRPEVGEWISGGYRFRTG